MDLFVVNRHVEDQESEPARPQEETEQEKLNQTLKRIERNKRLRANQKEKEQQLKEVIQKTSKARQLKREQKQKIVHVPENVAEQFLDVQQVVSDEPKVVEGEVKSKSGKKRKLEPGGVEGFTILGVDSFAKKSKVKRVLPRWLTNPSVISVNLQKLDSKVSDMTILDPQLLNLLVANKVINFFPVQTEVIPWLIESNRHVDVIFPRDICVSAPTGSGKTLAFVLPVIHILKRHHVKKIRALVILPTQDLARQVFAAFKTYSEGTNLDVCLITGQNSFEVEQKQLIAKNEAFGYLSKVDILVCTAGRLVDHLKMTEGLDLTSLEFLVVDEADRVLESVQNDWLYHLDKHIFPDGAPKILNQLTLQKHRPPQKLLFSATLSQDPEKLQQLSLFQPKLFTSVVDDSSSKIESSDQFPSDRFIGKYTTPKELTERYIETTADLKPLVLYKFVKQEKLKKTLVFTHSVESAHRLAILLKAMFKKRLNIEEISSNLQPKCRIDLINRFSEGKVDLLISTDALARGIDLPGVQCVISYSAPKFLKSYIHRAGRTARAGEQGLAVTFLHTSQLPKFKALLKQAEKDNVEEIKMSEEDLEPLGEQYKESLIKLKETVEREEKEDLQKVRSAKRVKPKFRRNKNHKSDKVDGVNRT